MKQALLLIGSLGAILAFSVYALASGWIALDQEIPASGWWAIGIGAALTILLGIGLMALTFYSARHGYDDRIKPPED